MDTPLMIAAKSGNTETVTLLMERGANIEAQDNEGRTPLLLAANGERQRQLSC